MDKCSHFCYNDYGDDMYSYINGVITEIESNGVTIENNKIGYFINVANSYSYNINSEVTIYLYQHVREDEVSLYGFLTKEEKELFLKLLNVKGVGCKMALGMFSGSVEGIIDAIERENILYLKKFPKVGEKVARQIILDLKGKLVSSSENSSNASNEFEEALLALGYKKPSINKVAKEIDFNKDLSGQIKDALKLMMK